MMTIEEFRELNVGDVVECKDDLYTLTEMEFKGSARNFIFNSDKKVIVVIESNHQYEVYFSVNDFIKEIDRNVGFPFFRKLNDKDAKQVKHFVRIVRENNLKHLIPEKEDELIDLKKEYEKLRRANYVGQLDSLASIMIQDSVEISEELQAAFKTLRTLLNPLTKLYD